MRRRVVLSCLCILVGYSIFGIFASSLRFNFDFPIEVYWLSFVLVSIPLLCEVVFWNSNPKLRLVYLMSFSLMIHLQYAAVDNSLFLSSRDAIADYELTDKMITNSRWSPGVQLTIAPEYQFYPITNFLYASTSLLTGIPLLLVVKYLFIIKALVVTPLAEKLFRSFFDHRVAYLATILFLASPGAILFPHKEAFAMVFFFLGIYAITEVVKTRQHLFIGLISLVTLIMTHHFSTYVFLGLLASMFLAGHFLKRANIIRVSNQFFMLYLIAFIAWIGFIASTIFVFHQKLLFNVLFAALYPGQLTFSELTPLYAPYERSILWLGYGITIVSGGLGFLSYVRNGKKRSSSFLVIALFLLPVLVVASIFRFSPLRLNVLISHRAYEFGYIFVGAVSAFFFVRIFQSRKKLVLNVILVCAIAVMIIVGPMAGAMHPRAFVRVSEVISFRAMSLNVWMSESVAGSEYTVGDKLVFNILSGYGNSSVVIDPEFFANQDLNLPEPPTVGSKSSYVVTYVYMTDFYGPNARKFEASPYFHNLYTNDMLNVYKIVNHTSS